MSIEVTPFYIGIDILNDRVASCRVYLDQYDYEMLESIFVVGYEIAWTGATEYEYFDPGEDEITDVPVYAAKLMATFGDELAIGEVCKFSVTGAFRFCVSRFT